MFLLQVGSAKVSGSKNDQREKKIQELIGKMTLKEKIGQMAQFDPYQLGNEEQMRQAIKEGKVGSILNLTGAARVNELQHIAVEDSRLGIPMIIGRDVIHGYRTIMPIPLGLAAGWNAEMTEKTMAVAAEEAASEGIHWTFAPMIDISRDPRWGRIAESCGEDTYLSSVLAEAMVKGLQGDDLSDPKTIAACAKHYVGYGAAEGGRDYNTTLIPETQLRNDYLPPFKAAKDAGVATFMSAFNDINGVPASGNEFTLKTILRDEWNYDGMVVSDWASIAEMITHGFAADKKNKTGKQPGDVLSVRVLDKGPDIRRTGERSTQASCRTFFSRSRYSGPGPGPAGRMEPSGFREICLGFQVVRASHGLRCRPGNIWVVRRTDNPQGEGHPGRICCCQNLGT